MSTLFSNCHIAIKIVIYKRITERSKIKRYNGFIKSNAVNLQI